MPADPDDVVLGAVSEHQRITIAVRDGDLFLENEVWPGRILVHADIIERASRSEFLGASFDGSLFAITFENAHATYRLIPWSEMSVVVPYAREFELVTYSVDVRRAARGEG